MSKKITKKDLIESIKKLYPYYNNLESLKKESLNEILNVKCNNIPIKNELNSCYIDSLLVSLFHSDNSNIKKMFLESSLNDTDDKLIKLGEEIRAELTHIYNIIQNIKNDKKENYCKNLRILLHNYYKLKNPRKNLNLISDQLEAFDIINLLNTIFNIKSDIKINKKTYSSNKKTKTIILKNFKLIRDVNLKENYTSIVTIEELLKSDNVKIKKMYPISFEDTLFDDDNLWKPDSRKSEKFKRKLVKTTMLSGKFLFIHINRNGISDTGEFEKINTLITPSLRIKMKENKYNLYLRSIIIHHGIYGGGHYVCVYECRGKWYLYDDLSSKIELIGNFSDVCDYEDSYYLKNCTNLVYY